MTVLLILTTVPLLGALNAIVLLWQLIRHKKHSKPILCMLGENCAEVLQSQFGRTFTVRNEIWGILYYITFLAVFFVQLLYPEHTLISTLTLLVLSSVAALYSLYLFGAQLFIIKSYCSWCIIAFLINLTLAGTSLMLWMSVAF